MLIPPRSSPSITASADRRSFQYRDAPTHSRGEKWSCGFYPGSHPREHEDAAALSFDQARADFEAVWQRFLSNRSEADFQAWRDERGWTARKDEALEPLTEADRRAIEAEVADLNEFARLATSIDQNAKGTLRKLGSCSSCQVFSCSRIVT
jgi:hypothetical protein